MFLRVFGVVLKPLRFIYIRNLKNSQKSGNLKKIVQNEENTLEKSKQFLKFSTCYPHFVHKLFEFSRNLKCYLTRNSLRSLPLRKAAPCSRFLFCVINRENILSMFRILRKKLNLRCRRSARKKFGSAA